MPQSLHLCRPTSSLPSRRHILSLLTFPLACSAGGVLASTNTSSVADSLRGSLFEQQGTSTGTDPLLLYTIALVESGFGRGQGNISPWPWTLRSNQSHYAKTKAEAEKKLAEWIEAYGRKIDIGMCQTNLFWHGHRVKQAADLLDPPTNLRVANQILIESLKSSPGDIELGIGRYHNWTEPERARNYGSRVLAIYRNLKRLG